MKFFVPGTKTEIEAKKIIFEIKQFVEEDLGWVIKEKKFYSINYTHDNKEYFVRVGEIHPLINEPVIAIFESNAFLICTPNRGIIKGGPILVGKENVLSV